MEKFIRNTVIFILIFIGLAFSIEFSTSSIINNYANFKFSSNPKYIILGHSHPECAFNDSLINSFKNLGKSGESYFYNYFKLKKVLEQNSSIETVFIEYTNNQITAEMDNWIWDDEHISSFYPKYSSFMSLSDYYLLIQNNYSGFSNAFSLSNLSKINTIINADYDYTSNIGGYLYLVRDKTDSILKHSNSHNLKNNIEAKNKLDINSESNLLYLKKSIDLLKKHNKKIILVRSPQHQNHSGYHNEKIYKDVLNKRFVNIEYLDFSNFPLSNSEYGDLEHLNHKGAKKFSIWFNKLIEDGLLLEPNKQKIIESKMRE